MGPSLRSHELAAWCRSRGVSEADETMLRAVFVERDDLLAALKECLQTYDSTEWTYEAAYHAFMKGQDEWWKWIRGIIARAEGK